MSPPFHNILPSIRSARVPHYSDAMARQTPDLSRRGILHRHSLPLERPTGAELRRQNLDRMAENLRGGRLRRREPDTRRRSSPEDWHQRVASAPGLGVRRRRALARQHQAHHEEASSSFATLAQRHARQEASGQLRPLPDGVPVAWAERLPRDTRTEARDKPHEQFRLRQSYACPRNYGE